MSLSRGAIAAGHPLTARAGVEVLRAGGNAVDAALAAVLASCVTEPLLTGLGAGGYLLVVPASGPAVLVDFFVEVPGRGADPADRGELAAVEVSFDDAIQLFHIGPAAIGIPGVPAGVCAAAERFARLPLGDLAASAIALARDGVVVNDQQAYVFRILGAIATSTPEARRVYAPDGRIPRAGDTLRQSDLAQSLERLAVEGAAPFYRGDVAAAICEWLAGRGALLTPEDLAAYQSMERAPVAAGYRGREVLSNPPPSAGGLLIARALGELEDDPDPPDTGRLLTVMEHAQAARTPAFLDGLARPDFAQRFLASRLGSTTHISVIDADGMACAVTCSNGEGSGIVVPGTGVHLNNMLGEQDLNPLGFHRHPVGRRLPSMMAPTVVRGPEGPPELALGSGGSNRIRSAVLQTIVNVVDRGLALDAAVCAPRVHLEDGVAYLEPGAAPPAAGEPGAESPVRFRAPNLFFGGVHAVRREPGGRLTGAGDPRRGGWAEVA